jgi:tRNA dimethylallyltransferase
VQASRPLVVVITGPTGTGKSDLALDLVDQLGRRTPAEIISMDSAQVYRGMDIGTAKPDAEVRRQLPHHLIDIRNPDESYSAGEFVRDALRAIEDCIGRGRLPILVGGTMLYLRALYQGMASLPPASPPTRVAIDLRAAEVGWPALHAELAQVDPQAATRINQHDAQRIQRALEVFQVTGKPISHWQQNTHGARSAYRWLRYALDPIDRSALRQSLAVRFERMLQRGLLEEVRELLTHWALTEQHPALRAVGYRQLSRFFRDECTLREASEQAIVATCQLARRQMTWLRRESEMVSLAAHVPGHAQAVKDDIWNSLDL